MKCGCVSNLASPWNIEALSIELGNSPSDDASQYRVLYGINFTEVQKMFFSDS